MLHWFSLYLLFCLQDLLLLETLRYISLKCSMCLFFVSFFAPSTVGWFVFLRTRTGLSTSQTRTINPVFASKLLDSTTLLYWFCVWIACWFQIFHQNYCFTKEALLGFFFNLSVVCRAALQLSIEATLWDNQRWLVNTEKPSQNQ